MATTPCLNAYLLMTSPQFAQPPHAFDTHTHRLPLPSDAHIAVYNLRLPSPQQAKQAHQWLAAHPWVYVSVGIHPWDSSAWTIDDLPALDTLLTHPQVVAVGECGLDRLRGGHTSEALAHQLALLDAQATRAQQHQLPLILHCVKAFDELLRLRTRHPNALWIVHGFRGKLTTAQQLWHKAIATSFGEHYRTEVLQNCPHHLRYHESDESSLTFERILALQQLSRNSALAT